MAGDASEGTPDYVIVGAGAAGCVLAARLSENPSMRVLLLEAGPDAEPGREHPEVRDPFPTSVYNPRFSWRGLVAETGVARGDGGTRVSRPFLQGYGVGGSSTINGMNILRGQPADYDEWQALGAPGWGWDEVLPYFRKLENDWDFAGPLNGRDGPMPIRRVAREDWAPFARVIAVAMAARGFPYLHDYNSDFGDGIASLPISSPPDRRVSAATAYLSDAVRRRPNLRIRAGCTAERVRVENGVATGVEVRTVAGREFVPGQTVIVACGGVLSPALLLRSGIGPGSQLAELGLSVAADLPGVGRNLQNHPTINLTTYLPLSSMQPFAQRAVSQNCLRFSSQLPDCHPHDMGVVAFNRTAWHPLGRRIGSLSFSVYRPYSLGSVELRDPDPETLPLIRFNTLDDPRDYARMALGLKFIIGLMTDPAVERARKEAFRPDPKIVASFGRPTTWNRVRTFVAATVLDLSPLRRALLGDSRLDLRALGADDEAIDAFVRQNTSLTHHVCGTCRMGEANDPEAVTDDAGRVRGIRGLHVGDPSIFPVIPRGGMYIQTIMAAEKLSDTIKREYRDGNTVRP